MIRKGVAANQRVRSTPFTRRVDAAGVSAYTVYNHMLLATVFESLEADYEHLMNHVQVWDVSCQRQVELRGPDAARLAQLMTPRDLTKTALLQGKYAPLCDERGHILNDPIIIKLEEDRWWLSIADSDIKLWAKGLACGFGLTVDVFEPCVWPLAVQGPRAEELVTRVFGDDVPGIRFFRGRMLGFEGREMLVMRSGWSKQGGFEIYLDDASLAEPLWDALMAAGEDLNVRAGCPNHIERLESGLLSYGGDMDETHNLFEVGLESYVNLDADIESLSLPALRELEGKHLRKLTCIVFPEPVDVPDLAFTDGDETVGRITAQVWSPRYKQFIMFAMMKRAWLAQHEEIEVGGVTGRFIPVGGQG